MAQDLIYIIADYSGETKKKIENVSMFCNKLILAGQIPFAPGLYINALRQHKYNSNGLSKKPEDWVEFLDTFMSCAGKVIVVKHKGFDRSKSVVAQIKNAKAYDEMEIEYITIDDL